MMERGQLERETRPDLVNLGVVGLRLRQQCIDRVVDLEDTRGAVVGHSA